MSATSERGRQVQAYVASNVGALFPKSQLVRQNETLPGGNIVDLHLLSNDGQHIFVEMKNARIEEPYLSKLVDYYTAISNLNPPPKSFKIVLIAEGIDASLKRELPRLKTQFMSLTDIKLPENRKRSKIKLSPTEARLVVALESRKAKLVKTADVAKLLDTSLDYASVLLHRLERKKWVDRISKGKYTFVPAAAGYVERFPPLNPLLAGSALVAPYYYSYATANAHHDLTTQMSSTVYIATTTKKPTFHWKNNRFKFVTLARRKFFGFTTVMVQGAKVNMAELEKAVVDSLDKPKHAGGVEETVRVVYRAYRRVDMKKLVDYAARIATYAVCQRLGFILDFLANQRLVLPIPKDLRDKLLTQVGDATEYIGPRELGGDYSREWRIIKTLPDQQLLGEIRIE
jgi:predicted transcriptional regulator of viral defense system